MATTSQETALALSKALEQHPEIFSGYQKMEHIIKIAKEVLGDNGALVYDVTDNVLTELGAPRVVYLRLYFRHKTPGTILAFFRIDVSAGSSGFKIESDNDLSDDDARKRVELGLERAYKWAASIIGTVAAEAMLSVAEQGTSTREVAQVFGPIGTMYSARTGKKIKDGLDFSNKDLPVAFSEMTGEPIDNLVAGIVQVHHDVWGGAIVSAIEAGILLEFGWNLVSEEKTL